MTTILAGIDVAQTVFQAARQAGLGFDLTFIKVAEGQADPNNYTAGKTKTETNHAGYGIIEIGSRRIGGTIVQIDGAVISIYAASLTAGIVPEINDKITIKGATYMISRIDVDPADAVYVCTVTACN